MSTKKERNEDVEQDKGFCPHLQHTYVGLAVWSHSAAIHLDVLQPLDVWLGVAENLALKFHVAAHHNSSVGW